MQQGFVSDDIETADVPIRLARYGLMESAAFLAEMQERQQLAEG